MSGETEFTRDEPIPVSIHAQIPNKLRNKLEAYYALNRRVKLFKKNIQPLAVRRSKPAFVLCRSLQETTTSGLVEELYKRCVYAYKHADVKKEEAVAWVMDNFPHEIQYELLTKERYALMLQLGEPLEGEMDDFFEEHLGSLTDVMFP